MHVFANGISANFGLYHLSPADSVAILAAVSEFDAAYALVIDPATKTKVTVAAKDDARTSAEQICRQYAIIIKNNAGISDPAKIAIGVRPVNNSREPINVPGSSPLLSIIGATQGAQTLRYSDQFTPDSPAKHRVSGGTHHRDAFANMRSPSNPFYESPDATRNKISCRTRSYSSALVVFPHAR